jgi:hypothetical protein
LVSNGHRSPLHAQVRFPQLLAYVNMVHWKDPAWHISMDVIVLDTIVGFVNLFKVMAYLNK